MLSFVYARIFVEGFGQTQKELQRTHNGGGQRATILNDNEDDDEGRHNRVLAVVVLHYFSTIVAQSYRIDDTDYILGVLE